MGYDLHITRKDNWFEDEPQIALAEWLEIIAADPSMRLDGFAEAELADGGVLRMMDETIAVWTRYSGHGIGGNMAWFRLGNGDIVVKNPDQEIRLKMWAIAELLGAKVQGDEGELYGSDGMAVA